jgi:hypothetical protein
MNTTFKRILRTLLIFILLLIISAFFLPSKVKVERKKIINTRAEKIYEYVIDLKKWKYWSPWHQLDTTQYNNPANYSKNTIGKGAKYCWNSQIKDVGKGCLSIIKISPNNYIETLLEFDGMNPSVGRWNFIEIDSNSTEVTWSMETDLGYNPIARYFGLFFDKMIGDDFEKGLDNLNTIANAKK